MLKKSDRILVTGGTGLIGTNLVDKLLSNGYEVKSLGSNNDLRDFEVTQNIFKDFKPTIVYHLAAKVGGIYANSSYKAAFYSDNVLINTNVVNSAVKSNVEYLFAMGTGCAYPKRLEDKLLKEEDFLDGIPEVTNDAYAYAKRGLLVHLNSLKEADLINFVYCLPANIYGPHDNFHPQNSHVVPGLIRRFCDAVKKNDKEINIWGNGSARRDFLFIKDCVNAMIALTQNELFGAVNVSSGILTSIKELAFSLKDITGFKGEIKFDLNMPAGQMQRFYDRTKMKSIGWEHNYNLKEGLTETVEWFKSNPELIRER